MAPPALGSPTKPGRPNWTSQSGRQRLANRMLHTIQASGGRIVSGGARLPATPENEPNLLPPPHERGSPARASQISPGQIAPIKDAKNGPPPRWPLKSLDPNSPAKPAGASSGRRRNLLKMFQFECRSATPLGLVLRWSSRDKICSSVQVAASQTSPTSASQLGPPSALPKTFDLI